jgi:hypothetical protein
VVVLLLLMVLALLLALLRLLPLLLVLLHAYGVGTHQSKQQTGSRISAGRLKHTHLLLAPAGPPDAAGHRPWVLPRAGRAAAARDRVATGVAAAADLAP